MSRALRAALACPELFVLTALSLCTRFWGLFDPREVVWDEVHYEGFVGAYVNHTQYLDVHPPLGNLLLALAAKVLGIPGIALAALQPTPMLRVLPALAGSLIIPVVYLLLRELGSGRRVATLGAALLLVDNALLVESRFILPDSMLLLFGMTAVLLYVAARRRGGPSRWAFLTASAVAAGMAASIKWTGLSALGLILLTWAADAVWQRRDIRSLLKEGVVLAAVPAAIYVASFAVHFAQLSSAIPETRAPFVRAFLDLNHRMSAINVGWATDSNASASPWYTWPISKHSIGFWSSNAAGPGAERWIVLVGNPVVWWGALIGMAAVVAAMIRRRTELAKVHRVMLFLSAGYALNFVPFAFIRRPMYLYHYIFALIFSLMLAAVGVGALAGWTADDGAAPWRFATRRSAMLYCSIIGLAALVFVYLAPLSYGLPLDAPGLLHRRWLLERHVSLPEWLHR